MPDTLKIERIEAMATQVSVRDGHADSLEWYGRHNKQLLVKVYAGGLCGIGEGFAYGAPGAGIEVIASALAPVLLGQDASAIAQRVHDMARAGRICGRSGIAAFASAAVEIALWDLVGKARGVSVGTLLGGARRTALPTYISLPRYGTPQAAASASQQLVTQGYTSLKLHQLDVATVARTRAAVGDGVRIMLDTNCAWPEEQAKAMAKELQPLQLAWLEEPVWPPEDYAALAGVRAATSTPIALGENEYTLSGFRHCLATGAADILQPSAAKLGLLLLQEVAALARPAGVPVVPHSFYFGPALAATAHFVSTLDGDTPIEFPLGDVAVLREPLQTVRGLLPVPQGPGLGVELDEDMLQKHQIAHRAFVAA